MKNRTTDPRHTDHSNAGDKTVEPVACRRDACDASRRGRAHQPNDDGEVLHRVTVGSGFEINRGLDKPLEHGWSVDVVAISDTGGDGLWRVRLRVGDRYVDLGEEDAEKLAWMTGRAMMWAAKNNQRDAELDTDRLQRVVWDLEEQQRIDQQRRDGLQPEAER